MLGHGFAQRQGFVLANLGRDGALHQLFQALQPQFAQHGLGLLAVRAYVALDKFVVVTQLGQARRAKIGGHRRLY